MVNKKIKNNNGFFLKEWLNVMKYIDFVFKGSGMFVFKGGKKFYFVFYYLVLWNVDSF